MVNIKRLHVVFTTKIFFLIQFNFLVDFFRDYLFNNYRASFHLFKQKEGSKNHMVDIYKIIACPVCKNEIRKEGNKLICKEHGCFKITERGIPVLFRDENDRNFEDGKIAYQDEEENKKKIYLKKYLFKKPKLYFGNSLHDNLKKKYIENSPKEKIILNIGSGHETGFKQENLINFDIYPHWNTHISGDAHHLTFLCNSIDVIWLCAVLEHIQNPFQVMEEVYRVLKPGGLVLISVPFLQYLHASPHDYFRYTKYGIRSICSRFIEIESGPSYTGPLGTIIKLVSIIPLMYFKNRIVKNALSVIVSWIFSPLLIIDLIFKSNDNEILTGGICYLGKKM
jgi:SAM-dependent methyltransferase/uncharacterized protein YbaR (Trm112 family)